MKKIAVLSALLCAGAAAPALAAWHEIATIRVSGVRDNDTRRFDLGGPVDRLMLRAEGSDIRCRAVTARYGNGRTQVLFQGPLVEDVPANLNIPGNGRNIASLNFECSADVQRGERRDDRRGDRRDDRRADRRGEARIIVVADVDRYRKEWRSNPRYQNEWSKIFNWGSDVVNDWRPLTTVSFEGKRDTETTFTGWRGDNVDAVALMPVNADARCARVTARFGNGKDQPLNVNNGDFLRRGQYYKLDLPGRARDLVSLNMRCRATDARNVQVRIFTSR
jgi:hypothetical protein